MIWQPRRGERTARDAWRRSSLRRRHRFLIASGSGPANREPDTDRSRQVVIAVPPEVAALGPRRRHDRTRRPAWLNEDFVCRLIQRRMHAYGRCWRCRDDRCSPGRRQTDAPARPPFATGPTRSASRRRNPVSAADGPLASDNREMVGRQGKRHGQTIGRRPIAKAGHKELRQRGQFPSRNHHALRSCGHGQALALSERTKTLVSPVARVFGTRVSGTGFWLRRDALTCCASQALGERDGSSSRPLTDRQRQCRLEGARTRTSVLCAAAEYARGDMLQRHRLPEHQRLPSVKTTRATVPGAQRPFASLRVTGGGCLPAHERRDGPAGGSRVMSRNDAARRALILHL